MKFIVTETIVRVVEANDPQSLLPLVQGAREALQSLAAEEEGQDS